MGPHPWFGLVKLCLCLQRRNTSIILGPGIPGSQVFNPVSQPASPGISPGTSENKVAQSCAEKSQRDTEFEFGKDSVPRGHNVSLRLLSALCVPYFRISHAHEVTFVTVHLAHDGV
jgi:hypothetical protein